MDFEPFPHMPVALPPFHPELSDLPPVTASELSVPELCDRYGLSRQSLYPRLNAAGVTGERRAQRTFFTPADVFRLDACHHYLSQGYGLKEIASQVSTSPSEISSSPAPTSHSSSSPSPASSLQLLSESIAQAVSAAVSPDPSPLRVHRDLQEIADNGWIVTTSVLASVIGFSNSTLHGWNSVEERFGFVFRRAGQGRWSVSRQSRDFYDGVVDESVVVSNDS